MKKSKSFEARVLKIASEIRNIHPLKPKSAINKEARAIAKHRNTYKVASEEKSTIDKKTKWKNLPEDVKLNIKKSISADKVRQSKGLKLPKAKMLPGGKVSPK
jgi:hypothetical protein